MRSWFRVACSVVVLTVVGVTLATLAGAEAPDRARTKASLGAVEQPRFLLDAPALLLRSLTAVSATRSLHTWGRQPNFYDGKMSTFDIRLDADYAVGRQWTPDAVISFRRIGDNAYVEGDEGFWSSSYQGDVSDLTEEWFLLTRFQAETGWERNLFLFTQLHTDVNEQLSGVDRARAQVVTGATVRGRPAIVISVPISADIGGGVLRVELDAQRPYLPLEIYGGPPGRHIGLEYDEPFGVTAVAGADNLYDYVEPSK